MGFFLLLYFVGITGVSSHSAASDADYAVPPDAVSNTESNHSDEPEPKLLKTCAAFTAENIRKVGVN